MHRMSCLGLIGALLLVAAAPARAQYHAWPSADDCGCNACPQVQAAHCCSEPLVPSLLRGIHNTLGCLVCCPGLNARHDIYRAALNRNDFNKCGFPLLPIYVPNRCCGPVCGGCQQCGPTYMGDGEIIESGDMPGEMYLEPTPAGELDLSPTPQEATPGPEARRRPGTAPRSTAASVAGRPATQRTTAVRTANVANAPRPVAAPGTARRTTSGSPVQRAGLLDAPRR